MPYSGSEEESSRMTGKMGDLSTALTRIGTIVTGGLRAKCPGEYSSRTVILEESSQNRAAVNQLDKRGKQFSENGERKGRVSALLPSVDERVRLWLGEAQLQARFYIGDGNNFHRRGQHCGLLPLD